VLPVGSLNSRSPLDQLDAIRNPGFSSRCRQRSSIRRRCYPITLLPSGRLDRDPAAADSELGRRHRYAVFLHVERQVLAGDLGRWTPGVVSLRVLVIPLLRRCPSVRRCRHPQVRNSKRAQPEPNCSRNRTAARASGPPPADGVGNRVATDGRGVPPVEARGERVRPPGARRTPLRLRR